MGWRGTLRSVNASIKRLEKEQKRQQRAELHLQAFNQRQTQAYYKKQEKLGQQQQAIQEVANYESYIQQLKGIHKECCECIDWNIVRGNKKPELPSVSNNREKAACEALECYKPSIFDKLPFILNYKIKKFEKNIQQALSADKQDNEKQKKQYEQDLTDWNKEQELAYKILQNDFNTYIEVIDSFSDIYDIKHLGSEIKVSMQNEILTIDINVHSDTIIPKDAKSLTKTGKLSVKEASKTTYYELYQDYVCSAVLRTAREIFAVLPLNSIIINAFDEIRNGATGNIEPVTILSTLIHRNPLEKLKHAYIDPSDAISSFTHNMQFKKTSGFSPVERIQDLIA